MSSQPQVELTITLPTTLQNEANNIASAQVETISDMIRIALEHYLKHYQQQLEKLNEYQNLEEARNLMRELGKGLGESKPPHDVARNHDVYLYS